MRPFFLITPLLVLVGTLTFLVLSPQLSQSPRLPSAAPLVLPDRNAERARATYAAIQQHFRADNSRYFEVSPADPGGYATLWPLTQTMAGMLIASRLTGQETDSVTAFDPYWDAAATPPGYSASMRPPLGSGDRKFFDDNAWTGLQLVQAYRVSAIRTRSHAPGNSSTSPYQGGMGM